MIKRLKFPILSRGRPKARFFTMLFLKRAEKELNLISECVNFPWEQTQTVLSVFS